MALFLRWFWTVIFIYFLQLSVVAQNNPEDKGLSFTASKLILAPQIDGDVLGDKVWQSVEPINEMVQIKPLFGQPASEKTEIRVAFTKSVFYVAVICYDASPQNIVVSDSRRDADLSDEDSFLFIIDTYNDQQNGFLFGTNSNAMEYDAQIDNEGKGNFNSNRQQSGVIGGTNLNWDASWNVKAETGDYGWSAEFAIPFRSLRFIPGNTPRTLMG